MIDLIMLCIITPDDAFYFCDGLIFTHFAMSKNFAISRTIEKNDH